jgi:nicotinamidase-related amidase
VIVPIPDFFRPEHAARWSYRPSEDALFAAAQAHRRRHGITAAASDRRRVHLLLVDMQRDFCHPEGALYVGGRSGTGALDDTARVARFIYENLGTIGAVTCTLDTHYPFQIFFSAFWVDAAGEPVAAYREITAAQLRAGEVRPRPGLAAWLAGGDDRWLLDQCIHYCESLERAGKYTLYLWPPHCLLGSEGNVLAGVIQEARLFHAYCREAENPIEIKGGNPLTENYSILSPEVLTRFDAAAPLDRKNERFVRTLLEADCVVIAGEASSHCVKSSVEDLLEALVSVDPALAAKVYLLADCMSAVVVRGPAGEILADFTPQAEAALARFAGAGMLVVASTTPMADWPGLTR